MCYVDILTFHGKKEINKLNPKLIFEWLESRGIMRCAEINTVGFRYPFFEQPGPDLGKAESLDPKETFMLVWSVSFKPQTRVEAR